VNRRKVLFPLLAGLIAFLTVAGGGTAYALWAAHAQADLSAVAASIGITAAPYTTGEAATSLDYEYDAASGAYATAAAVQVRNGGNAPAKLRMTFSGQDPTVPNLLPAITVTVGVVGDSTPCLADTSTTRTKSSTLASAWTYDPTDTDPAPGYLVAGGTTVTLCIRTSIDPDAIADLGATGYTLDVTSSLEYADSEDWTATATVQHAVQQVATDLLFFDDPAGRYKIYQWDPDTGSVDHDQSNCVAPYLTSTAPIAGVSKYAVVNPQCDEWNRQWRLLPVGDDYPNQWYISNAIDDVPSHQPAEPRWTANGSGQALSVVAQDNDLEGNAGQRWTIVGRGDGTFQIVNVASGLCASRLTGSSGGADNWTNPGDARRVLDTEPCQDAADAWQGFVFEQIGTPIPAEPLLATCAGSPPWSTDFSWPQNAGYQGSATYQIWIDGAQVGPAIGGWDTHWRPSPNDQYVKDFLAAHGAGGAGGWTFTVKQSISSGAWSTYATGTVYFAHIAGQPSTTYGIYCSAP